MAVVSLGSCIFTIDSMFAFSSSPDSWDSSRVAAAIPSGVGFLGAGLIYKQPPKHADDTHEVHGLTTASSIWLSAAVGIGAGGGLCVISLFATMTMILILRFGPHMPFSDPHAFLGAGSSDDPVTWSRHGDGLLLKGGPQPPPLGGTAPPGTSSSSSKEDEARDASCSMEAGEAKDALLLSQRATYPYAPYGSARETDRLTRRDAESLHGGPDAYGGTEMAAVTASATARLALHRKASLRE